MKAIVWHGKDNNDFNYEDVKYPTFNSSQIVVKVEAVAICGSDLHLKDFNSMAPLIPGHEVSGIVVEAGEDVRGIKIGDRVAIDPVQKCGTCYSCRSEFKNLCVNYRHLGDGVTPGAWAQYMPVDAANAYKIADNLSFSAACLIEPAAVCCQSFERAKIKKGDIVLILGDGPFGFLHAMAAKGMGADKVIVAGHYNERLKRIARKTGAVICNTHNENLEKLLVSEISDRPGVDITIEATGSGSAPNIGIRALRPQGTLVLFSYVWKPDILEMGMIHMKELNVIGSCRSNCYTKALQLMADGKISTLELADKEMPLRQYKEAINYLMNNKKNVFKIILLPQI